MNLEGMDPEDQVAALMDLLYMYRETDDPGVVPPMLDHQIVLLLHSVLSMAHNRPLARRVHRQLSQMNARAEETGANEGYGQAVRVVELVYNVIVGEAPRDAYNTQSTVGSGARTAILQAFMDQGVYARPEPFPGFEATPCQRFSAPVCDEAGNVLTAMDGAWWRWWWWWCTPLWCSLPSCLSVLSCSRVSGCCSSRATRVRHHPQLLDGDVLHAHQAIKEVYLRVCAACAAGGIHGGRSSARPNGLPRRHHGGYEGRQCSRWAICHDIPSCGSQVHREEEDRVHAATAPGIRAAAE